MQLKIKFNLISDIYDFIALAQKCKYHVTASQDRYIVDAKSILGLFTLDLRQPVTIEAEESDFSILSKFVMQ